MPEHPEGSRRPAGGDLVIPVMAVAFTLYFFTTIQESPWTAKVNAYLIGGVLLALCLIFFGKTALEIARGRASLGFGTLVTLEDWSSGRGWLFILTVGFIVLIDWGGFTLTTFLFLVASMAILGKGQRMVLVTVVSAIMALGGWALFIWMFDTRFPRGWFETAMKALLSDG